MNSQTIRSEIEVLAAMYHTSYGDIPEKTVVDSLLNKGFIKHALTRYGNWAKNYNKRYSYDITNKGIKFYQNTEYRKQGLFYK